MPSYKKLIPRGFLRAYILKIIEERPRHGYEIMKSIHEISGWKPSPGAVYPTLKHLKEMGFIQEEKTIENRRCYKITQKGKNFLKESSKKRHDLKKTIQDYVHCMSSLIGVNQEKMDKIMEECDMESMPKEFHRCIHELMVLIVQKSKNGKKISQISKILKETSEKISKVD